MTPVQARQAATEGLPVRIAVASNRGHKWVTGTIDRFCTGDDTGRVSVLGDDGVRYSRCAVMSVVAL
jgi:hypothetical protein